MTAGPGLLPQTTWELRFLASSGQTLAASSGYSANPRAFALFCFLLPGILSSLSA